MQVKQVTAIPLRLPLKEAFDTAHDRTKVRALTLLEIQLMDGSVGYGEIQSFENTAYAPENQQLSWSVLPQLVQVLKDHAWNHPQQVAALLDESTDYSFAKAGLEMACWDAYGHLKQQSLAQLLGVTRKAIPVGKAIGLQATSAKTEQLIGEAIAQGYQRIKLKMVPELTVPDLNAWDDSASLFTIDFNNALPDKPQSTQILATLKQKGITLVEEPLQGANWSSYQTLANQVALPLVSLDESINDVADVERALALDVADAFTLKPGKLGGIGPTLLAQSKITQAGKLPWIGGMLSSGIGRFVDAVLAAKQADPIFPPDSGPTQAYLQADIIVEKLHLQAGQVELPSQPGLGFHIDWSQVQQYQTGPAQIF
ncbi:O-succinylbenzoate synthase [Weissella uvarum]|uniref:enolase C-terminal domain-like protein n=1 Tax=Weissella uvarum TaxID=1479233 RepID=UPI001961C0D9|nr:enolase C-terminal domain-like protein [Weissella uvarum]MBM7616527.1 O-succinylbenzoate synthase [Weissella uvarum]MCM0595012.1 o-succinylbenzoate synthase [Weissella uvarum]